MSRFVTKVAAGTAAFALAATPGVAGAQGATTVDDKTGPVSYANIAAVEVGPAGQSGGGTVVSETQKSPSRPGSSQLAQDQRKAVPNTDGERQSMGSNYSVTFGRFDAAASPYPDGVASKDHAVIATLRDTTVPAASVESNFAFQDLTRGGTPLNQTVIAFQGAKSAVECPSNTGATAATSAAKLWIRDDKDALAPVDLPAGGGEISKKDLKLGPAIVEHLEGKAVDVPDLGKTRSDVVISPVTKFDQLLRQKEWRSGDTTAVAGWHVQIVTHVVVKPAEPENGQRTPATTSAQPGTAQHRAAEPSTEQENGETPAPPSEQPKVAEESKKYDVKTDIVLGGVSCSLPNGFSPVSPGSAGGGGVPVKIPAGYTTADAVVAQPEGASSALPLGIGLLGGGAVLGAAALVVGRRRKAVAEARVTE
ncbi:hypothetical protein [Amycolatopsis sp. CA-230715]|uniref:hypothetical protein n=1 Tax=Amycolatopsis sp. CA-230715 TaxID=2745196 RepID=UPI001C00E3F5|nr:hypothetical protein [Amycolatopsis sp. CA-230715]QWF77305.1 hypothetical protein HUW46_00697 [Amycolatopsis sp. CA-230715]